jgi:hypothetical protein
MLSTRMNFPSGVKRLTRPSTTAMVSAGRMKMRVIAASCPGSAPIEPKVR